MQIYKKATKNTKIFPKQKHQKTAVERKVQRTYLVEVVALIDHQCQRNCMFWIDKCNNKMLFSVTRFIQLNWFNVVKLLLTFWYFIFNGRALQSTDRFNIIPRANTIITNYDKFSIRNPIKKNLHDFVIVVIAVSAIRYRLIQLFNYFICGGSSSEGKTTKWTHQKKSWTWRDIYQDLFIILKMNQKCFLYTCGYPVQYNRQQYCNKLVSLQNFLSRSVKQPVSNKLRI